jgi:DNA-nicking Smr family endonuclease
MTFFHYRILVSVHDKYAFSGITECKKEDLEVVVDDDEVVQIPIDGVLDLHMFLPNEAASVVDEYLRACIEKGIYEVRIIHGKGKGVLRRTVHALLEKHPLAQDFRIDTGRSAWGATVVRLKKDT